jgi:hypothetical protein
MGAVPCVTYNFMIQSVQGVNVERTDNLYFAWAQGFMSALNARAPSGYSVRLLPDKFPPELQQEFLRDFCTKTPSKKYLDGIIELYLILENISP